MDLLLQILARALENCNLQVTVLGFFKCQSQRDISDKVFNIYLLSFLLVFVHIFNTMQAESLQARTERVGDVWIVELYVGWPPLIFKHRAPTGHQVHKNEPLSGEDWARWASAFKDKP